MSLGHGEHMNKINYQRELERLLDKIEESRHGNPECPAPRLLLHSCCAPCSSYCIEYLSGYFEITVFYYNPNLYPNEEYEKRVSEQKRFIEEFNEHVQKNEHNERPAEHNDIELNNIGKTEGRAFKVSIMEGDFEKALFYETIRGLEEEPERGGRCTECFRLRLGKTAEAARKGGFDFFATTLTISPQKNAEIINTIGLEMSEKYGARYLATDFKKREGYKRSIELSREFGLYRQDYCGCEFSSRDRERQRMI